MKFLPALLLVAGLESAQTVEQRADKIITDVNQAENTMHHVMAESVRLKPDIDRLRLLATPPVVAPLIVPPHHSSLLPFIDNAKIPAPEVGFATARVKVDLPHHPKPSQNTDGRGQFRFTCTFSHMNYDDPIVYPGQEGASHLHVFFGNTGINYASTQESIEKTGNSTCSGGTANRSGYWVPAVIDTKDGTPLKPSKIMVYYKTSYNSNNDVKPFPAGLRIVAGDMKSAKAQSHMRWYCLSSGSSNHYTSIPKDCPVGSIVEAEISFPMCWDGVNLDSPDHKSHMSYAVHPNICPATHPVEVPQISEKVQYIVTQAGSTARWRLSSDNYSKDLPGGYSIHADWFNGWDPNVQDIWIKNCLQAARDCHGFLLGDGTTLF